MIGNTRITQAMKNKMAELENPFYLYDQETILGQVRRLHRDFPDFEFLYSIKTNPFLPVVKTILGEGLGLDGRFSAGSGDRCGIWSAQGEDPLFGTR